jgi:hypothetical protein
MVTITSTRRSDESGESVGSTEASGITLARVKPRVRYSASTAALWASSVAATYSWPGATVMIFSSSAVGIAMLPVMRTLSTV